MCDPVFEKSTSAQFMLWSRVRACIDYEPSLAHPEHLHFKQGDIISVIEAMDEHWSKGSLSGKVGLFPLGFVEKMDNSVERAATTE